MAFKYGPYLLLDLTPLPPRVLKEVVPILRLEIEQEEEALWYRLPCHLPKIMSFICWWANVVQEVFPTIGIGEVVAVEVRL